MFKNMKIRTRLLISYAVIISLCLCASIVSLFLLNKIGNNLTSFYENNYTVTVNVATARREMQSARADILRAIIETDQNITESMVDQAGASLAVMRGTFPVIRQVFKGDIALVDEADNILKQAIVYRDQVFALTLANNKQQAYAVMKDSYVPLLDDMANALQNIADTAGKNAEKMVQQGQQAQKTAVVLVSAIMLLSIALAVIIALYISNTVRRPIREIEKATQKLAEGELEAAWVDYKAQDELGELADHIRSYISVQKEIIFDIAHVLDDLSKGDFTTRPNALKSYLGSYGAILASMQNLRDKLSSTLLQINLSADQVSAGGEQVAAGSQTLAQGATEQACSVEELAASIAEISGQVTKTAQNAQVARDQTMQTGDSAADCNKQMQKMIAAMDEINHASYEIEKIIQAMEEISFQTEILALNAAVEAARSGAAGKGFAVVASEVRRLANQSSDASKNTTALIKGSIEAVQNGMEIAAETAQALLQVVQSTKIAYATVDSIADAAKQQAAFIAQVTEGIEQISAVVQNNTATSEESAAASEELSGQALLLKSLVERFKLQNDNAFT